MQSYEEIIFELEKELLKPEIRKSPMILKKLLSNDFIEYCSSGKIYKYNKEDTFYEENVSFEIMDFESQILANDCILATYKIKKIYHLDNSTKRSIRSSIWKCFNGNWKMIFHQGTLTKEIE